MVKLTFANGSPNTSMAVGDLVYYISNPTGVKEKSDGDFFYTSDGGTGSSTPGISSSVYIGAIGAITFDDEPDQIGQWVYDSETDTDVYVEDEIVTKNTFTVFVDNTQPVIAPAKNDFIFFAKDNRANLSSMLGYYNSIKFTNNSPTKAELFAVSCGYAESSK